jgi:hypothetical protein
MKYKNFNFPEFPSKMQLFKKLETRRKYFDTFLRTVLNIGNNHSQIKKDIMKILYEFLFSSHEVKLEQFKKTRRASFEKNIVEKSTETFQLEESKTVPVKEIQPLIEEPSKGKK